MVRRLLRITIRVAVLSGAAYLVARLVQQRRSAASGPTFAAQGAPWPPAPVPGTGDGEVRKPAQLGDDVAAGAPAWIEPTSAGCPESHPVKAKMASGIFHVPGGAAYERTSPDRCYRDVEAAEADGLRQAKR